MITILQKDPRWNLLVLTKSCWIMSLRFAQQEPAYLFQFRQLRDVLPTAFTAEACGNLLPGTPRDSWDHQQGCWRCCMSGFLHWVCSLRGYSEMLFVIFLVMLLKKPWSYTKLKGYFKSCSWKGKKSISKIEIAFHFFVCFSSNIRNIP